MYKTRDLINKDLSRYHEYHNDDEISVHMNIFYIFAYLFISRGFRAVFCYRVSNYLYKNNKSLYYPFKFFDLFFNSSEISSTAEIGPGLLLPHNQCIVIGGGKLGKNVSVFQGVTIGLKKKLNEYPTIGDNVQIGAGAKILGNIKIGNNSRIGANAVVLKDVPNDSIAVGIPARVIGKNLEI